MRQFWGLWGLLRKHFENQAIFKNIKIEIHFYHTKILRFMSFYKENILRYMQISLSLFYIDNCADI